MVVELARLENLGYFEKTLEYILLLKIFIMIDIISFKITGYDVKQGMEKSVLFCLLQ